MDAIVAFGWSVLGAKTRRLQQRTPGGGNEMMDPPTDDDLSSVAETEGLLQTLYVNMFFFVCLMTLFEVNRHMRSTYLKRVTKRFQRCNRVPPPPSSYPFAWVLSVMDVDEEEFLHMVGLDGYMLLRYINVCFRMSVFFTIWGLIALVPVYGRAKGRHVAWNKYTLANIPNNPHADQLWVPAVFAYVFSVYFCHLMYAEYKNFVKKRVQYLIKGDPDTPPQTYYTVMVEKVPISLRSAPALEAFFEKLFPGGVYSVEVALDLNELDALTLERRLIRNALEKAIALYKATGRRPTRWIRRDFYKDTPEMALSPVEDNTFAGACGCIVVDGIAHLTRLLVTLNEGVRLLQIATFHQRQKVDEEETERQQNVRGKLEVHATQIAHTLRGHTAKGLDNVSNTVASLFAGSSGRASGTGTAGTVSGGSTVDGHSSSCSNTHDGAAFATDGDDADGKRSPLLQGDTLVPMRAADPVTTTAATGAEHGLPVSGPFQAPVGGAHGHAKHGLGEGAAVSLDAMNTHRHPGHGNPAETHVGVGRKMLNMGAKIVGGSVGGLAKEGMKTATIATKGALRGVLEGIRAVELLTVGAYYKTSSTAFVTLKSRAAECSSHQMFLSHVHYSMVVKSAPNPKDCIWENISIPPKQIAMRRTIADFTLIVGAVFWSLVVGFITAIANLESLSKELPFLQAYRNTIVYDVLNNYLAVALLLVLLSLLPVVFDLISRSYEGLKLESEIQNSIMTRYFYYQLANVFVSVGLGSIASSLHQIIESPSSILTILGTSLPSLSMYFTNLLIVKTFTAVPLEMLRVWPLIEILSVRMCQDKKKCTIRELKTGAFANPPMLYGWIYPNLLMVLMIISTYCCIAPLLVPFGMLFYAFAYLMYKYQLLYVYINDYQSGGFMWYAVFNRSMLALICGILTLLGYLGIRETFFSGPFYLLAPLPFAIGYFWYKCEERFKVASMNLSLDSATDLDRETAHRIAAGLHVPQNSFKPSLFRQPSLAEGPIRPKAYRSGSGGGGYGHGQASKVGTPAAAGKYGGMGSTSVDPPPITPARAGAPELRNVTFTAHSVDSVDASRVDANITPRQIFRTLGVPPTSRLGSLTSPLHGFDFGSPSPARDRAADGGRYGLVTEEGDVEGGGYGYLEEEDDDDDSEDERDAEANEILMRDLAEGHVALASSGTGRSRHDSDPDLVALDQLSHTHMAAASSLLKVLSNASKRDSSAKAAAVTATGSSSGGGGGGGGGSSGANAGAGEAGGQDLIDAGADDEAAPILPLTVAGAAGRSSSPRTSPSGAINGGSSSGIRGYGSTDG